MKSIKIEEKNFEAIVKAINEVEGKSSVNLLDVKSVEDFAVHAEERLAALEIPQKDRPGAKFSFCPAGPSANAYRYTQGATSIRIARKSAGWYVEEIARTSVYPKSKEKMDLMLTVPQKDIAVQNFCRKFMTLAPVL